MMNGAHQATGMWTGAVLTAAAENLNLIDMSPAGWFVCVLACGGWALFNDIDHDKSMFTKSGGLATRALAETLQALSRSVYRNTGGPKTGNGEHRGFIHSPFFAAILGNLIGLGCHLWPQVGAVALALVLSPAIRSLAWELHQGIAIRVPYLVRNRFGAACIAVAVTITLWSLGGGSGLFTWWFGVITTAGMVTHSLGDTPTPSGIPWGAPFTWRRFRIVPRAWAFSVGSERGKRIERRVAQICIVTSAGITAAGIAGIW